MGARSAPPPLRLSALDPCVHCGFCLPACPTYLATGDEDDSPRGRIVLMRALEHGELAPTDPALRQHLDACLGCRGCEPACPSGVEYGLGLETVRQQLAAANGVPLATRLVLGVFGHRALWRLAFGFARFARSLGLTKLLAGGGRVGFAMGMVEATRGRADGQTDRRAATAEARPSARQPVRPSALLFTGCVQAVLFDHVHAATRRVLEANGYRIVEVPGQHCCGAPHQHSGCTVDAQRLAAANLRLLADRADYVAVNAAGCGAILKDYGHLLRTGEATRFAATVKDVTELLALAGPRPGAPLDLDVAYDPPCHLQHAQRVHAEPLAVLGAIPGLRVQLLPGHDRCCGGAGTYGLLHPELSQAVLADKVGTIRDASTRPRAIVTGNPGCTMQIGAGLQAAGLDIPVWHPVEVLDLSYREAGYYPS
ncbi:MAG TPA: heterodisulfide reductase-related iron-sulfur binding cluster [Gemmatimonadales bacterium]